MQENWDFCYKLTRKYEGGNDDDPHDPGGRTSRGIIQREYNAYRTLKGKPQQDVWKATEDEINEIYITNYWNAVQAAKLPAGLDLVIWDAAVNSGVSQATVWAQRAANKQGANLNVDKSLGPQTLVALQKIADKQQFIKDYSDLRLAMLKGLSTWGRYGKGWTSRVNGIKLNALMLAQRATSVMPQPAPAPTIPVTTPTETTAPKATVTDRTVIDIIKTPEGAAAAGTVMTSVAAGATGNSPIAWAFAIAIVVAVLVGGYYFVRRMRNKV